MRDAAIFLKYLFDKCIFTLFLIVVGFAYLAVLPIHLLWMMLNLGSDFRDSYRLTIFGAAGMSAAAAYLHIIPEAGFLPAFNLIFEKITTGTLHLANAISAFDIGLVKVPVFGLKVFNFIANALFFGASRSNVYAILVIAFFLANTFIPNATYFNAIVEPIEDTFGWIPRNYTIIREDRELKGLGRVSKSKFCAPLYFIFIVVLLIALNLFITLS